LASGEEFTTSNEVFLGVIVNMNLFHRGLVKGFFSEFRPVSFGVFFLNFGLFGVAKEFGVIDIHDGVKFEGSIILFVNAYKSLFSFSVY